MTWRIATSTVLLVAGVGLVVDGSHFNRPLITIWGLFFLLFVPALIVDESRRRR